jgi:hypothetical protein
MRQLGRAGSCRRPEVGENGEQCHSGDGSGEEPCCDPALRLHRQGRADAAKIADVLPADRTSGQVFVHDFPLLGCERSVDVREQSRFRGWMLNSEEVPERFGRAPEVVSIFHAPHRNPVQ